ncbi:hypothetical protein [Ktedonobacter robiniae]|uniref:hypothetical protein n=1 Tax=Ktedonobacter robiniae TaxID=2778365 RepID=UPI00191507F9|nr:hypothetical protein [Ktedonobacter robiniae]
MGENPGTIDVSAYLIVLEGARCPNASGFNENILRTGKPSSNTPLREQCLAKGAKGNRARRVSAVRRLLPPPTSVVCEQKPVLLGPIRWVDVAGRALRRTWTIHWRRQHAEIIALVECPEKVFPPPRPPREVRSHYRWRWPDRLACNAWWGPPQLRVTVAGVPAFLAIK